MSRQTVLVIDDDPAILDFLGGALQWEGYQVLTVADGDALRVARSAHLNVILLDLILPGMAGREIGRCLKADARTADIPIILISASNHMGLIANTLPVNDRLEKPFPLQVLYAMVACRC